MNETKATEIIEVNALQAITQGEIDCQISTAKKFPRSLTTSKQRAFELATMDRETAGECWFAIPRAGKLIEGPSVRFAEILAYSWGNIRAGSRIIEEGRQFVTAQGVCHDLETNVCVTVEVKRKIISKNGSRFSDDMIGVTMNAACSIAFRNAVFKTIPKGMFKNTLLEIKRVALGDGKEFTANVQACLEHFKSKGISNKQVFDKIGKKGVDDINFEDLTMLRGIFTAVKDGEASLEEIFTVVKESSKANDLNELTKELKPEPAKKSETTQRSEAEEKEMDEIEF